MMDVPETRYAVSPDGVHIAYHVVGEGPVDVLWLHSFNGGLEMQWEHHLIPELTEKLNTFARVIRLDMRGTGLSDRYAGLPDLETEVRDIVAVLDAAGSRSTVVVSAANVAAAVLAATYPRRVRALCLFDPEARATVAPDYPWGVTDLGRHVVHDAPAVRRPTRRRCPGRVHDPPHIPAIDPREVDPVGGIEREPSAIGRHIETFDPFDDADAPRERAYAAGANVDEVHVGEHWLTL